MRKIKCTNIPSFANLFIILVFAFFFFAPCTAFTSPFSDVYKAGVKQYKNKNYKAAVNLWGTLLLEYQRKAPPKHLYKVAVAASRACLEMGNDIEAAKYARKALIFVPDGDKAKKIIASIEKKNSKSEIDDLLSGSSSSGTSNRGSRVKTDKHADFKKLTPEEANMAYQAGRSFAADKEYEKAAGEYKKAALSGNGDGCLALGNFYLTGIGVEESIKEAAVWIQKGAQVGNIEAMYKLSRLYKEGAGVTRDLAESVRWCKKAAAEGLPQAQFALAFRYETGSDVDKDLKEAVRLYKLAAKQGYADAQNNLGTLYRQGRGVKADSKVAFTYYQEAAKQGHGLAQVSLGLCYSKGIGAKKDSAQAALWLKKAADNDDKDAHAQYVYGFFLEKADGDKKDLKEAEKYYEMAAKNGHSQALKALSALKKKQ